MNLHNDNANLEQPSTNSDDTNHAVMRGAHVTAVALAVDVFHEQTVARAD
jgi:hypothetical protein